jgi:hypothetical protein
MSSVLKIYYFQLTMYFHFHFILFYMYKHTCVELKRCLKCPAVALGIMCHAYLLKKQHLKSMKFDARCVVIPQPTSDKYAKCAETFEMIQARVSPLSLS